MHTHMHTWSFICTSLSKATEMYNGIKCGRHCSTWDHLVKCFDCIMNMPTTYKSNYKRTLVGHFPFSFVCLQIVHGNRATWLCGCVCFRKAAFLASNVKKKKTSSAHSHERSFQSQPTCEVAGFYSFVALWRQVYFKWALLKFVV